MKTLLTALVAGLLGAGASIGAVVSGVVPLPETQSSRAQAPSCGPSEEDVAWLQDEVTRLNRDLKDLRDWKVQAQVGLDTLNAADDSILAEVEKKADRSDLDSKADRSELSSSNASGSNGESVAGGSAPAPAANDPAFADAVRAEVTRMQEEAAEERRLDEQARRVERTEEQKQRVEESVPAILADQAERLGINQQQIDLISPTLIEHSRKRIDLMSELERMRIDGEEVTEETLKDQFDQLDLDTTAALSSIVADEETVDRLLRIGSFAGRGNTGRRGGGGNSGGGFGGGRRGGG